MSDYPINQAARGIGQSTNGAVFAARRFVAAHECSRSGHDFQIVSSLSGPRSIRCVRGGVGCGAGPWPVGEPCENGTDAGKVVALARLAVMRSSGFISAWEFDPFGDVDGEELHEQLREALGISEEEYRSQQR